MQVGITNSSSFSTTTLVYSATPITVTITPKFSNSILYVTANVALKVNSTVGAGAGIQIRRDGVADTSLTGSSSSGSVTNTQALCYIGYSTAGTTDFYDKVVTTSTYTANNTSATTFTVYVGLVGTTGTIYVGSPANWGRSEITVFEIAQ